MTRTIDLNADLGEGFGADAALLEVVTSASIACGFHAGDADTMLATMRAARERGVAVGAHPSYRDRAAFGRRETGDAPATIARDVAEQLELAAVCAERAGVALRFVKPHGALYHRVARDREAADALIDGVDRVVSGLPVLTLPGGVLAHAHPERTIGEGFPDRGYAADGSLLPRGEPGAVAASPEAAARAAVALAGATGRSTGVRTLCVHGDEPHALAHARAVRSALAAAGIGLAPAVP